jgi:hypothetical protein
MTDRRRLVCHSRSVFGGSFQQGENAVDNADRAKKTEQSERELTEKERKLIDYIRNIEYGEIHIFIQSRQPVRVEETKTSILL